jgi:amino-acid N-acetyltransferase
LTKITSARREDFPAVLALLESSGLPVADLSPAHLESFLVILESETPVGCAGLEWYPPSALLRSLAVKEAKRGQGLGARLLSEIEEKARTAGIESIYLLTTTAEVFFSQHGYRRVDRDSAPADLQSSQEFLSQCPSSAVCMVKSLGFT